jgi:SAM-dependent methyltransferase
MLTQVKHIAQKSKTAIITHHIYDNWRTKRRFRAGNIASTSGSTHTTFSLHDSLHYIDQVFQEYLTSSGISKDSLRGQRILEIGPGDNVGVAIKFLVAGAKQVVCLDKFYSSHAWEQERNIYQALREQLTGVEKQIFDEVIDLNSGIRGDSDKLTYLLGTGIEEAEAVYDPASFDLIVSRAVFEHVYDPDAAFSVMEKLLKPGGYMLHKIDFRDHGMFSKHHHHPLTFLTIPDRVYRLMVYDSGKPNRKLVNYYRQTAAASGFATKILIANIVGVEHEIAVHKEQALFGVDYHQRTIDLLSNIRPHLQHEFKSLPDEELMISSIFLIARKQS